MVVVVVVVLATAPNYLRLASQNLGKYTMPNTATHDSRESHHSPVTSKGTHTTHTRTDTDQLTPTRRAHTHTHTSHYTYTHLASEGVSGRLSALGTLSRGAAGGSPAHRARARGRPTRAGRPPPRARGMDVEHVAGVCVIDSALWRLDALETPLCLDPLEYSRHVHVFCETSRA